MVNNYWLTGSLLGGSSHGDCLLEHFSVAACFSKHKRSGLAAHRDFQIAGFRRGRSLGFKAPAGEAENA